ncbi:hypothetical protein CVT26_010831 [Gymnopilus dilepis]|uniref:Uncharacterized protein n=1 Tax=Gymnopilus dilepis TaxID=231916 RepID=A0A409VY09_9AGAR|nr:hypothetical protein CVT26_010831 [Gymnopilus dilepis]
MTPTSITVTTPPDFPDLQQLADSTLHVFDLFRPWYRYQHPSPAVESIKAQVRGYMSALQCSIEAARCGHAFAMDAVAFAGYVESNLFSEEERQGYLQDMHDTASKTYINAEKASQGFRDVRRKMFRVTTHLHNLEKGIPVIEEFEGCISLYASWWNKIIMDQKAQSERCGQLVYNYNSLRMRSVVDTWKKLQRQYADYVDKVQTIQDAGLEFSSATSSIEGSALLFAPIFALGKRPMRKRDHIRAWGHRVWEEVVG